VNIIGLIRYRLCASVAFCSAACYFIRCRRLDAGTLLVFTGVFLLSACASAINQIQEWRTDALMPRTKNRPIPSGRLKTCAAFFTAFLLGSAGFFLLLYFFKSAVPAISGAVSIIIYNCLYTPLKRIAPYAFLAGALSGAIAPLIGWTAAGGFLTDPVISTVALFLYLWQIPHFLLLNLLYRDEYLSAGFPPLNAGRPSIFLTLAATAGASLLFLFSGAVSGVIRDSILILSDGAIITLFLIYALKPEKTSNSGIFSISLYCYQALIIMLIISAA